MHDRSRLIASTVLVLSSLPMPVLAAQDDLELWRARYRRVETELREIVPHGLTAEQAHARAAALDALRAYWQAGCFGLDASGVDARAPLFVDDGGRRCAIAFLMDCCGENTLVEEVARTRNGAWLVELTAEPRLAAWLARTGLTPVEAARIQGPGIASRRFTPPPPPPPPPPPWTGPEDARVRPRHQPVPRAPAPGAVRPGTPGPGTVASVGARPSPRGAPVVEAEPPEWEAWWEATRAGFWTQISPPSEDAPATLQRARMELAPRLRGLLGHADAGLRRAAVHALAAVGASAPELLTAVADPQYEVRLHAALALARLRDKASPEALAGLLQRQPDGVAVLLPALRVGLGVAGVPLEAVGIGDDAATDTDVRVAALVQAELTDAARLETLALESLDAPDLALCCRAAEALGRIPTTAAVAALTRNASGENRELRRSAAAALGRSPHALALPALQTAYDLEREQTTRAALLLALGARPEPSARAFLLMELRTGPKALRCFAALALARAARAHADDAAGVRAALREGFEAERNHSAHGAWLIAFGLGRDVDALELLDEQLVHGTPSIRMAAAEGLALLGGDRAAHRLQRRLAGEPCPIVRAALADGLCAIGIDSDLAQVGELLRAETHVEAAAAIALAMGRRPSTIGLAALEAMAFDAVRPAAVRAAALTGLARMLRQPPSRCLVELVTNTNWRAMPPWLGYLLATAL